MPIQLIIRNPLDRDAREFIQRAGVTDAGGRSQINEFVRGVKGLGLWDSMVCWPLRSLQNAGTGTTAYSLGGFGTYNATLVNGPPWGVNGIDTIDQQSVTISLAPTIPNWSQLWCRSIGNNTLTNTGFRAFPGAWRYIGTSGGSFVVQESVGQLSTAEARQQDISINVMRMVIGAYDLTTTYAGASGTLSSFVATARPLNPGPTMSLNATQTASNTHAFAAVTPNTIITSAAFASFYNLYKQTLGTGLGLP